MLNNNPYTVRVTRYRRRFRPEVVGGKPVEVVDTQTGEVTVGTQLIGRQKLYDSSDFIKIFDVMPLMTLNKTALSILLYLLHNLQFGGFSKFNYKEAMQMLHLGNRTTIYRGIKELQEKDIVRPKQKGEYWLNPNIAYRGQRDQFET